MAGEEIMKWWQLVWLELKAITADKAIAITLFGGILLYSVLYPLPYLHQVPTKQKIVVVDLDHSSLSRKLIRDSQASPQLSIVASLSSINEAKNWITHQQAQGLLVIPANFSQDLKRGNSVTLAIGADASYFLVYSAIAEGLIHVIQDFSKQIKFQALMMQGTNPAVAQLQLNPVKVNTVPTFNLSLGYTPYVVPGLFLLILQQTMLIGICILGAGQWQQKSYWQQVSPSMLLACRVTAFLLLYSFFTAYYVGWCYYWYKVNIVASLLQVSMLLIPFLLATALGGIALSSLFTRRDLPTQVVLLSSMPILFAAGFVWPLTLVPEALQWLSQLFPVTPAIMGMLELNQMGASWQQIQPYWWQMWLQCVIFGLLAWWGIKYRKSYV